MLRRQAVDGVRGRAPTSSPAARSTRGTPTRTWPGPAPTPQEWGRIFDAPPGAGQGAGVRGGAGDLRGVRRAAGRASRPTPWSRTPPATTGRATGRRCSTAPCRWPSCWPGGGLVLRAGPAAALVAVDHAGHRAAPVRHPVLRRRAAGRPAHQGRRRRGRRGGPGSSRRGPGDRAARRDRAAAAHRGDAWPSWPPAATWTPRWPGSPTAGARQPEVLRRDGGAWLTVPGVTEYPACDPAQAAASATRPQPASTGPAPTGRAACSRRTRRR